MINHLERGKTVTSVYCAKLLRKLPAAVKNRRRGKLHQGVLLYHDNTPAHTSGW